ncbi:AMP-binding protein [Yinghuangia soli]|uniref:AMP-binding protein n=1 Tax=Yinghuangia soli TaxID=2908204 RepID=A0AA41Q825_9ACTN|nr:AMP-binding protein [Yinghuangia soli]MCF2533328.1 AMP-binding protein [Yinghuangia soli]
MSDRTSAQPPDPGSMLPDRRLLLPNALRHWAAATPDAVFLEHVDGRRLTYRAASAAAERWAAALRSAGVAPGEHVAYLIADPLDSALVWLGAAAAGNVAVPVNSAYFGRMLAHVLDDSDAVAVVVAAGFLDRLAEVADGLPGLRNVVIVGESDASGTLGQAVVSSGGRLPDSVPEVADAACGVEGDEGEGHEVEGYDTAAILYTSGTTGPSKGVVTPWAAMHGYWSWVPDDTLTTGEALYCPMPLFHISGLGALHYTLSRGGRFVTRDKFSGTAFWDDVRAAGAVAAGLVGPMTALLHSLPARPDDADNPLRGIVLGPMIAEIAAFEARFGVRVATSYGMTEVPPLVVTGWDHGPWQTSGRVRTGYPWAEVRVVDEHDVPVPVGATGELVVRAGAPWALNAGYYKMPEATARAWRNGWFHTGDAFRQDEDSRFYFVDRMKDAIRRRGENISSFEVEAFVLDAPSVAECAAFAVPGSFGGDEVMIAVVPADGDKVDPAVLAQHLADRMPGYMVPRYIDVVEQLPRNTTSLRIQKHVLRERGVTAGTWDRAAESQAARVENPADTRVENRADTRAETS